MVKGLFLEETVACWNAAEKESEGKGRLITCHAITLWKSIYFACGISHLERERCLSDILENVCQSLSRIQNKINQWSESV